MSNFRKFISMSAVAVLAGTNLLTSLTYAAEAKAWANLQSSDFERNPLQFLMPDQNVYLYAVTAPNDYYVKFNGHGETSGTMGTQTFTYDKEQALSGNAYAKTGYSFSGWTTEENGGGSGYTNNQVVKNLAETGTVDLYAQWKEHSYTIHYDLNDSTGSSSGVHTKTPASGTYTQSLTIANATREGYNFSGWNITGMDTNPHTVGGESSSAATANNVMGTSFSRLTAENDGIVNFIAQWTAKKTPYKVEHYQQNINDDEYTLKDTDNLSGDTDTVAEHTSKGYSGFDTPNITKNPESGTINADESTVITYKYPRKTYNLTLVPGRGVATVAADGTRNDISASSTTVTSGFKYEEPVVLSFTLKQGYTGGAWTGTNNNDSSFTMPNEAITKTASADVITYKITTNPRGGTVDPANETGYTVETETFKLNEEPTRPNSVFSGWIGTNGSTPEKTVTIAKGSTGDREYTAVWGCVAGYHIENTGATTESCVADTDTKYYVNHLGQDLDGKYTVNLSGYEAFGETNTTTNVTGIDFDGFTLSGIVQTVINGDGTGVVNAYYNRDSYDYEITTPAGGVEAAAITSSSADGAKSDGSNIKYEDTVTLNADMAPGYEFDYWEVKDASNNPVTVTNSGQIDGATFKMPASTVTITPHLKKTDYTITMDPYGGTITGGNTITYNVETSGFNLPTPTRDNSVFEGWKGTGDTTTPATAEDPLNIAKGSTGDRTYVAVWGCETGYTLDGNKCVANTYTVSINYKDGGNDKGDRVETETFTYDDANPTPIPNPTQSGYTFAGWTVSGYNEDTAEVDGNKLVSPTSGTVFKNLTPTSGATVTLVANWTANTDTRYEVHHYYSDLSGNYVASGVDYLSGITNDTVTFDPDRLQNYSGFVYSGGYAVVTTSTTRPAGAGVASTNIKKDGTTVIDLYYDRIEYTVTTAHDTGAVATHGDGTYKYGATVEVSADVKPGYHFVQWTGTPAPAPTSTSVSGS